MIELCDQLLEEYIKINPTINDFYLKSKWSNKKHIQPNIYSEKYYHDILKIDKKYLSILEKKESLTRYDRILKDDLSKTIQFEENYEIYMYMPVGLLDNILISYVNECTGEGNYVFNSDKDYLDFMKRLKSLNGITNEIILKMKNGMKNNVMLNRITVLDMIKNMNDILIQKPYKHTLNHKMKDKLNITIDRYLTKNLKLFLDFVSSEYLEKCSNQLGLASYKGGKDYYRNIIIDLAFDNSTPEQIHKLGKIELKRLLKIKEEIQKKQGVSDIDKYVSENKSLRFKNEKEVLDALDKLRDRTITETQKYFHKNNVGKYDIKTIPSSFNQHFAFYMSGDMENERVGTFFINTEKPDILNKKEMYVLSLHEGIPGHHYEVEYQKTSNIPDYFKIASYDVFSEGWGLYCESLGNYTDNIEHYFKNQYDIHRTLRLIIDTGMHYYSWSYEKCFDLMKEHLHFDEKTIHNEILRYNDMPGQALSYKIGEKAILYLKKQYKGDIRDFHELILKLGPCPLKHLVNNFLFASHAFSDE